MKIFNSENFIILIQTNALGIGADTGHERKACRRMSG
jgi:hypothetical protein